MSLTLPCARIRFWQPVYKTPHGVELEGIALGRRQRDGRDVAYYIALAGNPTIQGWVPIELVKDV